MALSAGYFIGGYIADKKPSVNLLAFSSSRLYMVWFDADVCKCPVRFCIRFD
jgi:hypothetical protein